jgi:PAS domain S-box-containing protein
MSHREKGGTDLPKTGKVRVIEEITRRKRAEEEGRKSEEIFGRLVKYAPAAIYEMDLQGTKFLSVNDVMCDILQYSREELLAVRPMDLLDPECRPLFGERIRRKLRGEKVDESIEYRARRKDGEWITADIHVGAITYTEGVPTRVVVVGHEITERKRIENALRQSEERYRALVDNSPDLMARFDRDLRLTFANPAWLRRTASTADELLGRRAAEYGAAPESAAAWERAALRALETGEPQRYEHTSHWQGQTRIYDAMVVPERAPDGGVASILSIARDVTGQKQVDEELRLQREDLDRAQAVGQIGSWRLDVRRDVLTWSDENYRIFGVPRGTPMSYEAFLTIVHPDDRAYVDAKWSAGLRGEPYDIEHRIVADGGIKWVREKAYLEFDDSGKLLGGFGITQDITERRRAEELAGRNAKTFRDLVERSPFGTYIVDSRFRIAQMNASSQDGAFRNVRPLIGRDFGEAMRTLWPEPVAADIIAAFRRTLETGEPYVSPRFTQPRGDVDAVESYEWELHRLTLPDGQYGVICYYFDSTRLRDAEEALRRSEEKYRLLVRYAPSAIYEIDFLKNRFVTVNEAMCRMFGYSEAELLAMNPMDILDRESRLQFMDRMRRAGAGKPLSDSVEYKGIRKDGTAAWGILHNEFRFSGGRIVGAYVVAHDITARKLAEEELRASEGNLRGILDAVKESIWVFDRDGRVLQVNPLALERMAMGAEDVLGKRMVDILPPDLSRTRLARLREVVESARPVEFEDARAGMNFLHDFWPILDESGRVKSVVSFSRDITGKKKAEDALRENEQRFRLALKNSPVAVSMQDRNLVYRWAYNHRTRRPEEIIGRTDADLFEPDEIPSMLEVKRRVLETGEDAHEERWLTSNGQRVFLDLYYEPLRDVSGEITGIGIALVNLTPQKLAEEALLKSERREREAAEKLRESEEKYRSIVESSQEGILMADPQGSITYANERFAQMLGYTVGELIGKPGLELAADAEKNGVSEKIQERRQGKKGHYEIRLRRKDGAEIALYVSGSPVLDADGKHIGNLAMYLDITEQKRAETLSRALAEQDRLRLGAAVEQASDSVVMFDLDGTIRYVNAAFETIAGLPRSRAVGRSYFDFLAAGPAAPAIREALAQGKPWHGALTRASSGGPPIELQVTFSPAQDPSGKVVGGLITETDVTQRNALQQQVRQAQKMEALGTMAGGITHDFNNILGTIVINTELALLDLDPSAPARRPLPLVLQAAARGKDLVKQIITFSRQRAWERKPLAIAPIVREAMDLLRSTLPKEISVEETIDDGSGIVLADPSHIHQILVNLCQNAALAMRDGGGHLGVGLAPVDVDEALAGRIPDLRPGPYVRLTVADTGCGMSAETLDRIFEPFFTTREKGQGSGLGLAVVHGIVKSYAGAIVVQSRPGRGTVFNIYFPRLGEEAVAAADEPAIRPARGRERILIVEDEEGQRTSLARGLERLGYRVTSAAEGGSALSVFRKDPGAFDLVLTDQSMPRMSGLELASEMVKLRPDIPILLCTGFSEKVDGGTVGQKGIRDLVMKPFTLTEISRLIRKALDQDNGAA